MPKKTKKSKKVNLNAEQQKAITHEKGPLLVIAGAGTGKTRVITEKIKYLIETKKAKPNEIMAVTFTEKASQEMLARLDTVMPLGYEEPWIYTFHSFADRILRNEGLEIGLDSAYKIISYPEQWLLVRRHLFDFDLKYFRPLGNPTKFILAILKFISRLQDENISPDDLWRFAQNFEGSTQVAKKTETTQNIEATTKEEKERWLELAGAYKKYEELKLAQSKMDFGDLIDWLIKLFKERPNILQKYQKQFKHVLVDEFQDTNYAQYELIKLLCPADGLKERSLLVVGDDSQSIYKFRGAAVSNILDFQKDYPDAQMITLLKNYRSAQKLLDAAYKLIKNNNPDTLESKLGISKELVSQVDFKGGDLLVPSTKVVEDEVEYVVSKILEILGKEPNYTYKDFAILARANNQLDAFVFALRKHGLPYQLVGNRGLYDREEVRDIIAFLRTVINPYDSINLFRVLNIKSLDVEPNEISEILATARREKKEYWDIVSKSTNEKTKFICEKITYLQEQLTKLVPSEFVYTAVNSTGYIAGLLKQESIENQLAINNLNLFLDRVKKFEIEHRADTKQIPTIIDFMDYLNLMLEAGENPAQAEIEDVDTINLLTVHSSKGLEFPVVFMVNLVSDRFPVRDRRDLIEIPDQLIKETLPVGDAHLQEERRLFYVGMTRAQKYLYLTSAKNYGGRRDKKISGYVLETGITVTEIEDLKLGKKQESLFGVNSQFRKTTPGKPHDYTPYSLSYSKISDFKTCPLKYKYKHVLGLPTPPSAALSFGTSIHNTLRDFHSRLLFGQSVSFDNLLKMYENDWQPAGYLHPKHAEEMFNKGKNILRDYFDNNAQLDSIPIEIEKDFMFKIGGIKFYGRIDRIDKHKNGDIEILDYKTGNSRDQKDVDKDEQMAVYAIAAREALGLNPTKLTLYFVEHSARVSTTRTSADLDQTKKEIERVVQEIKKGNFEATPGIHCNWCDFKDICPFAQRNV